MHKHAKAPMSLREGFEALDRIFATLDSVMDELGKVVERGNPVAREMACAMSQGIADAASETTRVAQCHARRMRDERKRAMERHEFALKVLDEKVRMAGMGLASTEEVHDA